VSAAPSEALNDARADVPLPGGGTEDGDGDGRVAVVVVPACASAAGAGGTLAVTAVTARTDSARAWRIGLCGAVMESSWPGERPTDQSRRPASRSTLLRITRDTSDGNNQITASTAPGAHTCDVRRTLLPRAPPVPGIQRSWSWFPLRYSMT
jgi:hypothetical protein